MAGSLLRLSSRNSELNRSARQASRFRRGRRHGSIEWGGEDASVGGLIAPLSHEHRQMRRHSSRFQIQTGAEPFADFLAKRHVIGAADLRGMSHDKNPVNQCSKRRFGTCYRRAVTRRASTIVMCEPGLRRQDAAKFGQTCVEQFAAAPRTSSRSPLASAMTSPAAALGAKTGKAATDAPRSRKIARADRDSIILGC